MMLYIIDESDTVTQKEISEILFLPKSTVHSLLLKLQKQIFFNSLKEKMKRKNLSFSLQMEEKVFEEIQEQTDIFETQVI